MVSLFTAKQGDYLAAAGQDMTEAAASGSSFVFTLGLIFAIVNFVLSLFMKKPQDVKLKD